MIQTYIGLVNGLICISLLMYSILSSLFIIIISTSPLLPADPGHHLGRQDPSQGRFWIMHPPSASKPCFFIVSSRDWIGHVVRMDGSRLSRIVLYGEAPCRDGKTIWGDPWRLAPSHLEILGTTGGEQSLPLWTGAYPPAWREEGSSTPPAPESSNPCRTSPMPSLSTVCRLTIYRSRIGLMSHLLVHQERKNSGGWWRMSLLESVDSPSMAMPNAKCLSM